MRDKERITILGHQKEVQDSLGKCTRTFRLNAAGNCHPISMFGTIVLHLVKVISDSGIPIEDMVRLTREEQDELSL